MFRFRFHTLLKLRHTEERALQQLLAVALQEEASLKKIEEEFLQKIEEVHQNLSPQAPIYLETLWKKYENIQKDSLFYKNKILNLQKKLKQATQQRKMIEKIKEKDYATWQRKESEPF